MASKNAPPKGADVKANGYPNQTLYCTNLPEKLTKHDLRSSLYSLFSTYGTVLDIVTMKTTKMRGQAHVVFRDVHDSTQALRALQGFDFFGKQMKIVYAKGTSHIFAKLRGTFNTPAAAQTNVSSDLQKSIFSGPPGAIPTQSSATNGEAHGVKRPRQDESDESDAPMDEDSDVPMDQSSDEE
ncbi:U1 small nuclear ribonucleoprotein A [Penicillium argentinense]|uniref:U1 small nuclear ribonucleoprotein A n=1 Tax=Penicillium argentinense TaxID=1131581 RepID=A0A9W9EPK2_9EURO|nr:U1 small nuclear ribonucleoprotein A [Penicillium argentinense]KAJ5085647.1 U1 small nuclear ribonucleoprotein A [Penicillium argentinense]